MARAAERPSHVSRINAGGLWLSTIAEVHERETIEIEAFCHVQTKHVPVEIYGAFFVGDAHYYMRQFC